jgi:hypothetical protein
VLLVATGVPRGASATERISVKEADHPCMALMQPTLKKERKKAHRIRAKDIESQILAFTNDLGRNPRMQETLECLMRQSD